MIPYKAVKKIESALGEHGQLTARLHALDSIIGSVNMFPACRWHEPVHFEAQEFVPPEIFNRFGADSLWFMDCRMTWTADAAREYFGVPITINDWLWGGRFKYRGYRPPQCTEGAENSQHRLAQALDFDVKGISAEEVRQEIKTHPSEPAFRFVTTVEDSVNWNHWDCRARRESQVVFINHNSGG
jgi:hypothetical protein